MTIDFSTVTELAGDQVSQEQVDRICHRYYWAGTMCRGKDVVEAACGPGQGLGYLAGLARSLRAGDYCEPILGMAREHYGNRLPLGVFDAQKMPFEDQSADFILLFEAIYYLPSANQFLEECRRVLRPGGKVLIATANKDLFDFNPSPFSQRYYGVVELKQLLQAHGFACQCYGAFPMGSVSRRQRAFRWVKKAAVWLHLMPKTMKAKKLLKRLAFGRLVPMPREICEGMIDYQEPKLLDLSQPDHTHKVIYCAGSIEKPGVEAGR
jgi:SAM-dependent methyltransferase